MFAPLFKGEGAVVAFAEDSRNRRPPRCTPLRQSVLSGRSKPIQTQPAPSTACTKSRIFTGSFLPGELSTPLATSTP